MRALILASLLAFQAQAQTTVTPQTNPRPSQPTGQLPAMPAQPVQPLSGPSRGADDTYSRPLRDRDEIREREAVRRAADDAAARGASPFEIRRVTEEASRRASRRY